MIGSLVVACSARVPRCPEAGESLRATDFIMEAGGKGFNVALAAHRLGVEVDGLFAVGADAAGAFARNAFAGVGLSPELILTVEGATGAGVGLIEANGENRIAVFPGANDRLSGGEVAAAAERVEAAALVVGQFEAPDAPILEAFDRAKRAGSTTLLNPSPYRRIDPALLALTDMLVVNQREAEAVAADLCPPDQGSEEKRYQHLGERLRERGCTTLIVTRGVAGALLWQHGERFEQRGFPVEALDSIGAGDAFTGGLIAALARGLETAEALRWGCAVGALAVTRLGVIDALPRLEELTAFLANDAETSELG